MLIVLDYVTRNWNAVGNDDILAFLLLQYPVGTGGSFLGVKRPGREDDHSPASSAEVKNTWSYASTPNTSSWRGA
jgi:hypothetical protein